MANTAPPFYDNSACQASCKLPKRKTRNKAKQTEVGGLKMIKTNLSKLKL